LVAENIVATGNLFLQPFYELWMNFVGVFPSIVVALLLLVIGYFIAVLVGHIVRWLLDKAGLDKQLRGSGFSKSVGHTHLPNLLSEFVKWFVFIIFLEVAVSVLNLHQLSELLDSFVRWLPNVLIAIIVFFAGVALAHYIDIKVRENTNMKGMRVLSGILKVIILFLVLVVGLKQLGIEVSVLENAFLILLAAVGLGFALATGIGLGLGLKPEAHELVKKWKKSL